MKKCPQAEPRANEKAVKRVSLEYPGKHKVSEPKWNEQGGDKASEVIGTRLYMALYDTIKTPASPE